MIVEDDRETILRPAFYTATVDYNLIIARFSGNFFNFLSPPKSFMVPW